MNYKQIVKSTRADKLFFTASTIIHLVPEFNKNVYQLLFGSGIQLTNCSALVTKAQTVKLGHKTFNTKKLYLDTKSALTTDENKSKVIPVVRMLPKTIEKNKFILIDHSILSKGTSYIQDMTSEKQTVFFLLNQIKNEFYNTKSKLPNVENILMFLMGSEKTEKSMADLINRLPMHQASELKMLFDKFMMVSVNVGGTKAKLFPIAGYKDNGNVEVYKQNINFMNKLLILKPVKLKVEPSVETPINKDELKAISITTTKKVTEKVTDDGIIKLEVNEKELNQVLRRLNINDKNIADNIKQSVDNYLKTKKDTVRELDLEKIILKAINQTVFNTDKIDSQYLDNPSKLISKLIEVNTFQKKLTYPEPKTPHILSPKVIELNRVTGLVRQEYEFSKNIHTNIKTLFNSLETRKSNPIKIQKISHEYQDNNLDRVIKYNITLKNLAGGYKKPYDVSIKIPALVNDRYFKLNGKTYIIANQQFFVPITKTDPLECRLLTNFATMTLSVVNMKFNISELDKILDYMTRTYPDLIKNVEKDNDKITQVELTNDVIIDLYGQEAYISPTEILSYDIDTDKWVVTEKDGTEQALQSGKAEFIFEKILEILSQVNPDEKLQKSSRSIPYIQLYLGDVKIPLIIYLWQQLGLINALIKLGIDNNISTTDTYQRQRNDFVVKLEDDEILVINPQNKREQLIVNGLTIANVNKLKLTSANVNKQESVESYITAKHGTRAVKNINHSTNNMIDPITLDILKFQDKSTNMVDIVGHDMVDKLLNEPEDALSDLKIYRSRQAEIMFELLYKVLMVAHNTYKTEVDFGNEDAKAFLNNNYVIDCLLGIHPHTKGNSVLEIAEPYNPVAELKMASKLIKSGPGGISSRQAKKEHRNLHKSNQGNIGANATTEYSDVGIVNHNTLTPLLSNQFGSFGMKNIENVSGWEMVSLDEGLVPFINETESGRAILAYTHRAQVMPIKDGDEPFVATGAEYITPQLASSRFLQKAKKKGKVIEVKKDVYVKVKYEDGMEEYIDTTPRNSSTSRASFILLDLETLETGEKFDVGESIAWTKVFNKDNCYVSGKNLKIAVMNYLGFSHEDSYSITSNVAETQFQTDILEEVTCIVPLNTKILSIITKLGTQTNQDDELMSFSYMGDLDDYLEAYNIIDDTSSEEEMIAYTYEKNKMQILSPGGELVMIKIFINNKQQVDPSITKLWKELVTDLKTRQKLYGKNKKTKEAKLEANDNLDLSMLRTGTHKYHGKLFDGARISFFIKREKSMSEGDKMCNRFGAKGVVGHIIPEDSTPYVKSIGDIDIFIAPSGVLGRKNLIIIKELYIGKIFYLLPEILSKKASNSKTKTQSLIALINTVYETLDGSKDKRYTKSISNKLSKMSPQKLRKMLTEKTLKLNFIVQPFENISFDNVKSVAKVLNIPLDEKVFIPETKTWTKVKVPVGVQYFNRMEQQATDYESLRSTGAYVGITGQPKKGRTDYSGQALGNLDIYNIITYDAPNILKELLTVRSDNVRAKRRMQMEIIQNGKVDMPILTSTGKTQQLKNMYVTALGLRTSEQA